MQNLTIARRYARALLEVGTKHQVLDAMQQELQRFKALLEDKTGNFSMLYKNPAFRADERLLVMKAICAETKVPKPVEQALLLLVEKGRFGYLPAIYTAFMRELDVKMGRVRAVVRSATPLSEADLHKLVQSLEKRTASRVVAESQTDPTLLGGLRVQVGSLLLDGSVTARLSALEQQLMSSLQA